MSDNDLKLEFVAVLAQELSRKKLSVYAVAKLAKDLIRLGHRSSNAAVALSNSVVDQDQYEKIKGRIKQKLSEVLKETGVKFYVGGDPRGCTLKLHFKSKRSNCFAGEGYGVPGS